MLLSHRKAICVSSVGVALCGALLLASCTSGHQPTEAEISASFQSRLSELDASAASEINKIGAEDYGSKEPSEPTTTTTKPEVVEVQYEGYVREMLLREFPDGDNPAMAEYVESSEQSGFTYTTLQLDAPTRIHAYKAYSEGDVDVQYLLLSVNSESDAFREQSERMRPYIGKRVRITFNSMQFYLGSSPGAPPPGSVGADGAVLNVEVLG
ncbi:hypothetical protein [Corynebacterium aquatimens]|uniref:Secreted protein n=1 Tax=Corynebacterium aquatimens TaxID=1190508 RepID=A0A931DZY1_9CORY|nr:hypothetical protein [Corynebacterium aquatimens]MBG6121191.1 hypothetical protein [Corynebacterium aquatimens]WJY66255.1 hypothetical protein CAQUA_07805 [Corynebacterium aquatimens]